MEKERYIYESNPEYPKQLNDYLTYLNQEVEKSQRTIECYKLNIVQFLKYIKPIKFLKRKSTKPVQINSMTDVDFKKIEASDIKGYVRYLNAQNGVDGKPIKKTTVNNKISSLNMFFEYLAYEKKIIEENVVQYVKRLKQPKREMSVLSEDEASQYLNTIKESGNIRDYTIFKLYLNLGLRRTELVDLDIDNIFLRRNSITFIGKGDVERTLDLNDDCMIALNEWLEERKKYPIKDEKALFLSHNGYRLSKGMINKLVKKYAKLANMEEYKIHTHTFRHTCATILSDNGVDSFTLQGVMGHGSITTTQLYVHPNDSQRKKAANSINI